MTKSKRKQLLFIATLAATSGSLWAQTSGSWILPTGGTWTSAQNWNSNPSYPDNGGIATLGPVIFTPNTITLNSAVTLSAIRIDSNTAYTVTGAGSIFLTGPATLSVNGPTGTIELQTSGNYHSILVPVTGTGGLTYEGNGTLLLGNASYTGQTTVNGGQLAVSNGSFGSVSAPIVLNGGNFAFKNNVVTHNVLSPVIVTNNNGTLGVHDFFGGKQINLLGPISGSGNLNLYSYGAVSIQADSPFNGALDVLTSPLVFEGNGRLPNAATIDMTRFITIKNNSADGVLDRIGDSTVINLRSDFDGDPVGISITTASSAVAATEQLGTLNLMTSATVNGDYTSRLAISQINRTNHALLTFGSNAVFESYTKVTGSRPVLSGSGSDNTLEKGIVPWMSMWGGFAITVDGSTGVLRPLKSGEYISALPNGITESNLVLSNNATVMQTCTVNSLSLHGAFLNGSSTITVASGGVLAFPWNGSNPVIVSAPVNLGGNEGIISGNAVFSGAIGGSGGLTAGGTITISGANTYTGETNILSGVTLSNNVLSGLPNPLGLDNSPVIVRGKVNLAPDIWHFDRDIIFKISSGFNSQVNVSFNGALEFAEGLALFYGGGTFEFAQPIKGAGDVVMLNSTGRFNSPSPLFAGIIYDFATVVVGADVAVGTGTVNMSIGTLIATGGDRLLTNPFVIQHGTSTFAGSENITITGPLTLQNSERTLNFTSTATTTFTNTVTQGSLIKRGAGTLEIGNARLTSLSVNEGPLRILPSGNSFGTSRVNSLAISAGATLDLTNNAAIIDYTGPSPSATIQSMLIDGRLFSSQTDATHTLGYAENSTVGYTVFAGLPVDATSVLVQFTYRGDANLDHKVDISDLYALASNWQTSVPLWSAGDFNFDGVVNAADLTQIAMNWQAGVADPALQSFETTLLAMGLPTAVPEPSCLLLVGIGALFCPRRRRQAAASEMV